MMMFTDIKTNTPNSTEQIAKELVCYDATIKICRNHTNMKSPYKKRNKKNSQTSLMNSTNVKGDGANKNENNEINDKYLNEILTKQQKILIINGPSKTTCIK